MDKNVANQQLSNQSSDTAVSIHRRSAGERKIAGCFGLSIAIIFGGGCLAVAIPSTVTPVKNMIKTRSWVECPCLILNCETHQDRADEPTTLRIRYQYKFAGRESTGDHYDLSMHNSSGPPRTQEILDRYRVGANAICFVNPASSHESVLNRNLMPEIGRGLVLCVVGIIAGLIPLRMSMQSFAPSRNTPGRETIAANSLKQKSPRDTADFSLLPSGATTLKPVFPMKRRFWVVLAFAVFWNAIVWLLIWNAFGGFKRPVVWDYRTWFAVLFFSPFVLIGFFGIVGVGNNFMKLFEPRPTLQLNPGHVALGRTAILSWSFSGRANAISKLTLSLRGQEWVQYGNVGDDGHMEDTSAFYSETLLETFEPSLIQQGQIEIAVPDRFMHSWRSGCNRIDWIVAINGTMRLRPDIAEEFTFEVTPHE